MTQEPKRALDGAGRTSSSLGLPGVAMAQCGGPDLWQVSLFTRIRYFSIKVCCLTDTNSQAFSV